MWKSEKRSGSRWFLYTWLAFCALFIFMWIADGKSETPIFISGGSPKTIAHHRHLLTALAAGDLTPVPNFDLTPRFPHGPDSYDVDDGEGLVLIMDSAFNIEGANDAAQTRSLRLFVPGDIYRDSMTLEFRNGQTEDGALLFVINTSHVWNWTIIGYPFEGTVRLNRTDKSNIDAEFDVVYRCIGYVYRTGGDATVHKGWEAKPAEECPQNLFPPKISFGLGVDPAHSERPEKLPYTGVRPKPPSPDS